MSNTSSNKHRVFVYGTLIRGARNSDVMLRARLISRLAFTKEKSFFMLQFQSSTDQGKYSPGVFENGNCRIKGQLYEVSDQLLRKLDKIEKNGVRYDRKIVHMSDNSLAWMYIMKKENQVDGGVACIDYDRHNQVYSWRPAWEA